MENIIQNIRNSGFTLDSIAKKSGLNSDRLNSIFNGISEPTLNEVRKICKVLKVSADFLISKFDKFPEINILFRQAFNNEKDKHNADKISYIVGNTFSLLNKNEIDDSKLKLFPSLENTFSNARILAGKFRQLYYSSDFVGPLYDLPRMIADELGCILFVLELGSDADGASAIIDRVPFIFISPRFEPRMLFTLAHELAHILSHHSKLLNFAKIDKHISGLDRNKFKDEAFANAFASELLMPEEGIGVTLQSIRKIFPNTGAIGDIEIIYLSRIYGVSFDVAAKRCEDLNLLPIGGAISLSEQIKKEYGNAEKRAKDLNIPERPKLIFPRVSSSLIESAVNKINTGEISIGKASEILSIPMVDIMNYKSIKSGYNS